MTREELILEKLKDAIDNYYGGEIEATSPYEAIDRAIEDFAFPVGYKNRECGEWDILTIAYLDEDGKIRFTEYTF